MAPDQVHIEISELRKRLRAAIDQGRHAAAARRRQLDEAGHDYEQFLKTTVEPLVQMFANALRAEGFPFVVFTPSNSVKLASGRASEDFIEFVLDRSLQTPTVLLRVNRGQGRRITQHERPIRDNVRITDLTSEDVLKALLEEIVPFVEK